VLLGAAASIAEHSGVPTPIGASRPALKPSTGPTVYGARAEWHLNWAGLLHEQAASARS